MRIVLFEDAAEDARLIQNWLTVRKLSYENMSGLEVVKPTGDWWDFVETRIRPAEAPGAPLDRAKRKAPRPEPVRPQPTGPWSKFWVDVADSVKRMFAGNPAPTEFWLVDLNLRELPKPALTKLRQYFFARCESEGVLGRLFAAVKATEANWDGMVGGLAIAAYAQQHGVPARFVSKFATLDIQDLKNLLSYLALSEPVAAPDGASYFFKKSKLTAMEKADLSDPEKAEYAKVFDWLAGKKGTKEHYFANMTRETFNVWVAGTLIAVVTGLAIGGFFFWLERASPQHEQAGPAQTRIESSPH